MNSAIGFVILSHTEIDLLERLIGALNLTYDEPPIAIHHDFSQSYIDVSRLKGNICVVKPSIPTQWAHVSVIHSALSAIRALYQNYAPEWFTLLSAADYPIMPGRKALEEIRDGGVDLYLDYQLAERNPTPHQERCRKPTRIRSAELATHGLRSVRDKDLILSVTLKAITTKIPTIRNPKPVFASDTWIHTLLFDMEVLCW